MVELIFTLCAVGSRYRKNGKPKVARAVGQPPFSGASSTDEQQTSAVDEELFPPWNECVDLERKGGPPRKPGAQQQQEAALIDVDGGKEAETAGEEEEEAAEAEAEEQEEAEEEAEAEEEEEEEE